MEIDLTTKSGALMAKIEDLLDKERDMGIIDVSLVDDEADSLMLGVAYADGDYVFVTVEAG